MQQQGGSPYGVPPPEMAPFSSPTAPAPRPHILGIPPAADQQMPEAASPISIRPPPPPPPAAAAGTPRSAGGGFEELVSGADAGGGFPDDEALAGAADETDRGGGGGGAGNRWPKQETLALIKIRSEMDAAFREATLKGPLWDEVSRKLGELGYRRSAKKCKEKFENVHKYHKRTKENRTGRQDGKSYRFFSQLEALGAASSSAGSPAPTTIGFAAGTAAMAGPSAARIQPAPISAAAPPPPIVTPVRAATEIGHGSTIQGISGSTTPTTPAAAPVGGISFSTNSSSSESDDTLEDEETEETGGQPHEHGSKRKRKGGSGGGGGSRKMMVFFEGLMKQVVERQEAMQQRFLETIEKREQDRMIREEAWRRQEMVRLTREQELMAQERAMAASRDAAVLSFIQKISGQAIQLPTVPATPISAAPAPAPMPQPQRQARQSPPQPPQPVPPQPQPQREFRQKQQSTEIVLHQASTSSHELVPVPDPQELALGAAGFETASSSRWPKAEVHALINLRSALDIKYQEAGPKGPLWEEISGEMKKLGYNRSSKRCKEKWENINKYFKKVKESNKKRTEDSKTCPYFHQLDALYRRKQQAIGGGSSSGHRSGDQETYSHSNPQGQGNVLSIMPPPPPPPSSQPPPVDAEIKTDGGKKNGGSSDGNGGGSGALQIQTSNGGLTPTLFEEGPTKKPEDIVKELLERRDAADDCDEADDSYNMDGQDDDDDDDEEDDDDDEGLKMRYEIQFQRPGNVSSGGGGNASTAAAAAATNTTSTTTTTTTTGSFLAMVQ